MAVGKVRDKSKEAFWRRTVRQQGQSGIGDRQAAVQGRADCLVTLHLSHGEHPLLVLHPASPTPTGTETLSARGVT
jgi:hypothetical protein